MLQLSLDAFAPFVNVLHHIAQLLVELGLFQRVLGP